MYVYCFSDICVMYNLQQESEPNCKARLDIHTAI